MISQTHRCELILALDIASKADALSFLQPLKGDLKWVKIGLQRFLADGPDIIDEVASLGFHCFVDLKLHDIPNTVASAIESLKSRPVKLLTLHTCGGVEMMQRAADSAREVLPDAKLVGVTVLTSMDRAALAACGWDASPEEQVLRLANLAMESGLDGVVCSPLEIESLRAELGQDALLVTPGVRPKDHQGNDDQKRVMTPEAASQLGSHYIVVGRPILKADNPTQVIAGIQKTLGH